MTLIIIINNKVRNIGTLANGFVYLWVAMRVWNILKPDKLCQAETEWLLIETLESF